jgi:hypothetical protein
MSGTRRKVENVEETNHLRDLDIDGRIILKQTLKLGMEIWSRFV